MRKLLFFIPLLLLIGGCQSNADKEKAYRDSLYKVLDHREAPYLYSDGEGGYVTYWDYMYNCGGFPDSIIVKVTRDGKFIGYETAYRWGDMIEDSLGNTISPGYVIGSTVGDEIVYNLKGEFVKFNESNFPHAGHGEPGHGFRP